MVANDEERYAVGLNVVLSGNKDEIETLLLMDEVHIVITSDSRILVDEMLKTKQFSIGLRRPISVGFVRREDKATL